MYSIKLRCWREEERERARALVVWGMGTQHLYNKWCRGGISWINDEIRTKKEEICTIFGFIIQKNAVGRLFVRLFWLAFIFYSNSNFEWLICTCHSSEMTRGDRWRLIYRHFIWHLARLWQYLFDSVLSGRFYRLNGSFVLIKYNINVFSFRVDKFTVNIDSNINRDKNSFLHLHRNAI